MTEVLFILTTIFVAYVAYVIVNEQKVTSKPAETDAPVHAQAVVEPVSPGLVAKEIVAKKEPSIAVKKPVSTRTVANTAKGSVRNPKTGEVAAVTNNYRFTKRWIKEALVAEGLLDKIYKNNELDAATDAMIKAALLKLEAMEQYRA